MAYRIGDVAWLHSKLHPGVVELRKEHENKFPNSIAGRYAAEYTEGEQTKSNFNLSRHLGHTAPVDWELLSQITNEVCKETDSNNEAILQIRLGDALCGDESHTKQKRPPSSKDLIDHIVTKIPENSNIKVLSMPVDHPLNSCKAETKAYLSELKAGLPNYTINFPEYKDLSQETSADNDLCEMINAPILIRGKGGFAALAEGLRSLKDKDTISDLAALDSEYFNQKTIDNWGTID